jgi:anti-sigma-K factor RskA
MSKSRPLTDAERADLVAYLDGELGGEAKRAIEARISLDPVWRTEAASLQRTWNLLDHLPRPEPSPSFTQRTLSRLEPVHPSVGKKLTPTGSRQGLTRWITIGAGWAAALVVATLAGYHAFQRNPPPYEPGEAELIRELRVIEHKRHYDLVDDIDFLRELDHPDLFGEESSGG